MIIIVQSSVCLFVVEGGHWKPFHHNTIRQVTRGKAKRGAAVKQQKKLVVSKSTSNVNGHFKSGFAPLYRSLVTSLTTHNISFSALLQL